MKTKHLPKALQKQADLRRTKTPDILAQQAVLNTVMQGRKGGAHTKPSSKRDKLAKIKLCENIQLL
jgi:hypothetical protein